MRIRGKGNGEESVTRRDDLGGLSSGRSGIHAEEQERSVREKRGSEIGRFLRILKDFLSHCCGSLLFITKFMDSFPSGYFGLGSV